MRNSKDGEDTIEEDLNHSPSGEVESRASRVGSVVAERYRVGRLLGEGTMGAVYEAEHVHMKKRFALKVLHRSMSKNPEVVARFEREAVAASRVHHPGVVAATDFGQLPDESFYLALEFVDGRSLGEALETSGTFPPERAFQVAFQVNSVLVAAHEEGIIHRDLKPGNVMLVQTDSEDFVKVLDFGIAKIRIEEGAEPLTQTGLVFGTPEYMSPEQAKGLEADARSDLYGVGMLLYEMLVGKSPFFAEDLMEMLTAQITEPAPSVPDEIPELLRALVAQLLKKDPNERPQTALELDAEFREIAEQLKFQLPLPRTKTGTRLKPSASSADLRSLQGRPSLAVAALHSMQGFSNHPVAIGSRKVPLWIPALAMLGGVAAGAYLVLPPEPVPDLSAHAAELEPSESILEGSEPMNSELQLLADARSGNRDAVAELRKFVTLRVKEQEADASSEQANRYLVLGRGYSVIKHYSAAIEMYREAVRLDEHLAEDSELLLDVRVAIGARDAVDDGLDFALTSLGSHGADLIFDLYLDNVGRPGKTPVVARAMKLVKSTKLLEQATPQLKVALRLQNAKLCGEYREVIPAAAADADERSVEPLRALSSERGCGTKRMNDCYICLRKPEIQLAEALARAESHPSPLFLKDSGPDDEAP